MIDQEDIQFVLSISKGGTITDLYKIFKSGKTKKLKAGEIYIDQHALWQKMAFIRKGLIRAYLLKEKGDEVTLLLRWENQFVTSHDGVFQQKPSRFIYQALEDTILFEIDYLKAQEIADRNPLLSNNRSVHLTRMMMQAIDRVESFVLLSPKERYLKLVQEKPDIVNRVPDKYLATYLGITPVSLSRIRKRIASEQNH